jgi:hypothetical protein
MRWQSDEAAVTSLVGQFRCAIVHSAAWTLVLIRDWRSRFLPPVCVTVVGDLEHSH